MGQMQKKNRTVLVTGATGRVGSKIVSYLIRNKYRVRAVSSRIQPAMDGVDWIFRDLRQSDLDFKEVVAGCHAVLHLGAEMKNIEDMPFINGAATGGIAQAVESMQVPFMAYVSSIAVYGSSLQPVCPEDNPTIASDCEIAGETSSIPWMKTYSRTKLMGEKAIAEVAKRSEYVIFRPTNIVDIEDIIAAVSPSKLNSLLRGHRRTHHVYVLDVAAALVWAMERALDREVPSPGVAVYNLSDETVSNETYADFWAEAALALGWNKTNKNLPKLFDLGIEYTRHSFGRRYRSPTPYLRFPADKLLREGFNFVYGMNYARKCAYSIINKGNRLS